MTESDWDKINAQLGYPTTAELHAARDVYCAAIDRGAAEVRERNALWKAEREAHSERVDAWDERKKARAKRNWGYHVPSGVCLIIALSTVLGTLASLGMTLYSLYRLNISSAGLYALGTVALATLAYWATRIGLWCADKAHGDSPSDPCPTW